MKRIRYGILASILLVSLLLGSCGGTANTGGTTSAPDEADQSEAPDQSVTEATSYKPSFEVKDWGGKTFTFLCTGPTYDGGYYETIDVYVESADSADVFNDAVLRRNQTVEDEYNVTIKEIKSKSVRADVDKSYKAGDDLYNAVFALTDECTALASIGALKDFNEIPNIDLSQPWWDQNVKKEFSLGNKAYIMTGDISVMDDNCTLLFFFNKKLIKDYSLTDPYQLLHDNKWTIDQYASLIKAVKKDLNGDGKYDDKDLIGNILAYHNIQYLMQGCGVKFVSLDDKGYPQITLMNDRTPDVFAALYDIFQDKTSTLYFNDLKGPGGMNSYTYGRTLFANDQILFCYSEQMTIKEFRNMESEFGLMPLPKYNAEQSRYYSPVDVACIFLAVPSAVQELDFTGYVLEAFAAESKNILTPAYYEVMLKRKYTRDNESAEVLDIVAQTRLYDPAVNYDWGTISTMVTAAFKANSPELVSRYEKIKDKVELAAKKTHDAFVGNEG